MLFTHGYMLLVPYPCKVLLIPANNDSRKQKTPRIVATINLCRSVSLLCITTIHNPNMTQKITDRKQVVCRFVDHSLDTLKIRNIADLPSPMPILIPVPIFRA